MTTALFYRNLMLEPHFCDDPVDVAFVMDSSASIGDTDYKKEKNFVKSLATILHISPSHSRGAIVLSGGSASLKVGLDQHPSIRDFMSSVDKLPFDKGRKRIDKAMDIIRNEVFLKPRAGVPKIAIVLNDGRQSQGVNGKTLHEASERLIKAGVRILVVGIGDVDPDELRVMTESWADIFFARNLDELNLKVRKIAESVCGISGHYDPTSSGVNSCANPENNYCHANAKCTNNNGSYTCSCQTGFVGDGITCSGELLSALQIWVLENVFIWLYL